MIKHTEELVKITKDLTKLHNEIAESFNPLGLNDEINKGGVCSRLAEAVLLLEDVKRLINKEYGSK